MLAFDDHGEGETLVFLHGLAASRDIWRRARGRLQGYRVIAVDVPGFGASAPVGDGFALGEVAEAIWAGLPADVERPTLIGHSMGGAVAMAAADAAPERVAGLVLCAPAGVVRAPLPGWSLGPVGTVWQTTVQARSYLEPLAAWPVGRRLLLGTSTAPGDGLGEVDVRSIIRASGEATRTAEALRTVARADQRDVLRTLPVPVGFMWGSGDLVVPRRALDLALAVRPEAEVELIAQTGHLPMVERPGEFAAALRRLLGRLAR